jgi:hypothetical protein
VADTLAQAQKKAVREGRTILFIDESGFYLLPMVVRSYAPRGLTPVLEQYLSRDHLAAIGAVTPQGQLFLQTYEQAISSERSKKIKAYLSNGAAKRIHLERFPGYAPELNPTEWVWSYIKVSLLANVACDTLPEVDILLQKAKRALKRKPDLIKSFIQHVGYKI